MPRTEAVPGSSRGDGSRRGSVPAGALVQAVPLPVESPLDEPLSEPVPLPEVESLPVLLSAAPVLDEPLPLPWVPLPVEVAASVSFCVSVLVDGPGPDSVSGTP